MDEVNLELIELYAVLIEERHEYEYVNFVDSLMQEFQLAEQSARSYDEDCSFYGDMI